MTDPASIRYRDEADILAAAVDPERLYVETIMPLKLRLSLEYLGSRSSMTDLVVLVLTLRRAVLRV
jgi:hypothetical protein